MLTLGLGEVVKGRGAAAAAVVSIEVDGVAVGPPLDGVELLPYLMGWTNALAALIVDRAATAQVSIDRPPVELCLLRKPDWGLELSVVSLEPEPRLLAPQITVELADLRAAVEGATRAFLRSSAGPTEQLITLERALRDATGRAMTAFEAPGPNPWTFSTSHGSLSLEFVDEDGRTSLLSKGAGSLAALLTGGRLTVEGVQRSGPPFLASMAEVRKRPSPEAFELGLALCEALARRHSGWSKNPWVEALFVRCTEGLAAARPLVPDTSTSPIPRASAPRQGALAQVGEPRRVTLTPKWSRPVALGEPRGRLSLSGKTVVVHAPHAAQVFTTAGKELRRTHAARGVAASSDGTVVAATESSVACFSAQSPSARWTRDDGGLRVGPDLELSNGRYLTRLGSRGLIALESLTGREAWRFDPPRTQRATISRMGERLLIGTDAGELFGIDVHDGGVRFRLRGPVPCPWPVAPLQRDGVAVFTSSSQTVLTRFAALSAGPGKQAGAVSWTKPLPLESASAPVIARGKIFVAGKSDDRGAIACLSGRGELLWLRSIPLDGASVSLTVFERGVVATDVRGAAVRLLPDGTTSWVVGGLEEPLLRRIEPALVKGTLVAPGVVVRLIDARTGRVLASTPKAPELTALAVGKKLELYTYVEAGALTRFDPSAVLSVVR